jgi:methoxymalonate biosynthesis acyl carrier protein
MEIDEIESDLERHIRESFGVPETDAEFNHDVDLFNYGYIDSFGAVELTNFIENRFSISLSESDWVAHPLRTISEISRFIHGRRNGQL